MRRVELLTLLVLAMLAVHVNAGSVTIRGKCVDCNKPEEGSTSDESSSSSHEHAAHPAGQSKAAAAGDDSSLPQTAPGDQSTRAKYRLKRQWGRQVITLDGPGGDFYGGGPVTTIDSRGYPGTLVRNSDCVGCNIRG